MNELSESIKVAMRRMLGRNGIDVKTVLSWYDRIEYGGYCETCAYEETVVDISYLDSKGVERVYTYYGSFSGLIVSLTNG